MKKIKRAEPNRFSYYKIILVAWLAVWLTVSCQEKELVPDTMQATVDQVVFPYVALGSNVGIIVGVIRNGEKTIYSYGEKELGKRDKLTSKTSFEIASATKTFTALALADMHLRGEVNLDDPVEKYLPSDVKIPSRNGKKITLLQLANHTSGLPGIPTNMDKDAYNPYQGYTQEKLYEFLDGYALPRDPGSGYQYSNLGYGLLGYVLSLKNNTSYESLIAAHVLQPLGMTHTSVSLTEEQRKDLAQGYYGSQKVESWAQYMQNVTQGAGALRSNLDDLLLYLEANMGAKSTPLNEAMALMQQLTFKVAGYKQDGIGLGWEFYSIGGQEITWKNGLNGAFSSFLGFNKKTRTGVVILLNSSFKPDKFQTEMGFKILEQLEKL